METTLTTRIADTEARLRADPPAGVASPTVVATLSNGHARLSSGPFNWESDLGPAIGGDNLAPSPTAYLLGALAGCGVVFLHDTLAPMFGVTIEDVIAEATCVSDAGGLLGIEGRDPALGDLRLSITVASPDPSDRIEAMFEAWRARCPIYLALRAPNQLELSMTQAS